VGTEYWIAEELYCQRKSGRRMITYICSYSDLYLFIVGQDRLDLDKG